MVKNPSNRNHLMTKPGGDNLYFMGGKQISRDEAMDIVKLKFPKIHDD